MAKTDFIQSTEVVENLNKAFEKHRDLLKECVDLLEQLKDLGFHIELKIERANV